MEKFQSATHVSTHAALRLYKIVPKKRSLRQLYC